MQKAVQTYIPALTGVRALAAYLVFISHYAYVFDEGFPHALQRFFQEFHIGVTIFFVLSGFLIAFRYYDNFYLTRSWFKQYLKNRVARIYPMYFLLTVATFAVYYFRPKAGVTAGFNHPVTLLLMNITFIRGFFSDLKFTGIAQGWSLTVEECFYFAAPVIFLVAQRYKRFYIQPLLVTGLGALLVLLFCNVNWYGFFGNFTFMMLYTFLGRCFEFFAGIQLALLIKRRGMAQAGKFKFTCLGFALIFVCVWLLSIISIPKGQEFGLQTPWGIITNNYLLAVSIAVFFYGLVTEGSILKRILAHPFTELLGKSSYIFYLIHLGYFYDFIHEWFEAANDKVFTWYDQWGVDWSSPFQYDSLNLLYAFILLNCLSILLFKLVEEPLNHYIRKSDFLIKYQPKVVKD
ncbi:acyltransferase family protein [Mucilaginibacter sp.]